MRVAVGDGSLCVRFAEVERRLDIDDTLVFGRGAELDIDTNPFLHRQLGRLVHREGWWWMENVGSSIVVTLVDPATSAASRLSPGTVTVITSASTVTRFAAGRSHYELTLSQEPRDSADTPPLAVAAPSTSTLNVSSLPLTTEQRSLLLALAEHSLLDPLGPLRLPSNKEVAARLGWTAAKLNRKLDWLCERLTRHGVAGLHRSDGRSNDRRQRLVEYALDHDLIGADDLPLLQ